MSNNLGRTELAEDQDQPEIPLNESDGIFDASLSESFTADASAGNVVVTALQSVVAVIKVIGVTTAGRTITLPQAKRKSVIYSDAANTQPLNVVRGTASIPVAVGKAVTVYTDGTENGLTALASSGGATFPPGGTTGQVLKKASGADGDVEWANDATGGGGGGGNDPSNEHLYWRLLIRSTTGGNAFAYAKEIQMKNSVGGANLATGGTPFSDGHYDTSTEDRAFDGNNTTYWESSRHNDMSTTGPVVIGYQFAEAVEIKYIGVLTDNYETGERPKTGTVQYSDDGAAYTNAWDFDFDYSGLTSPYFVSSTRPDVLPNTLPEGGTAGQVLSKIDGVDFNVEWINPPAGGGGSGGSIGAHRYWGLMHLLGEGATQIQALHWTKDGGSPVYPTHYYSSDAYNSSDYNPDNLLDDSGTYFALNGGNGWLYGDFGSPVAFDTVSILPVSAARNQAPIMGIVCYSDNGQDWTPTTIFSVAYQTRGNNPPHQWVENQYTPIAIKAAGGGAGAISAKHWRLRQVKFTGTHQGIGFAEIKWLNGSGTNLATGGTPTASNTDGSWQVAQAFDGSTASSNGWYSGDSNNVGYSAWIDYEFTEAVSPTQVAIAPIQTFESWIMGDIIAIDYSKDGKTYQQHAILNVGGGATDTFKTFDLYPA